MDRSRRGFLGVSVLGVGALSGCLDDLGLGDDESTGMENGDDDSSPTTELEILEYDYELQERPDSDDVHIFHDIMVENVGGDTIDTTWTVNVRLYNEQEDMYDTMMFSSDADLESGETVEFTGTAAQDNMVDYELYTTIE